MKNVKITAALALLALPAFGPAAAIAADGHQHHRSLGHHRGHVVARTVTFTAQVVRASARGLVVRRSDGRLVFFSTEQLRHHSSPVRHRSHRRGRAHRLDLKITTGDVVVNILGLQPGVTVQITESVDGEGNVTITITLPPTPPTPSGASASGVVTELDSDAFTIQTSDGSELRLHMSSDALSALNLSTCDTVDVSYHQDAGILVADSVSQTGTSTAGDCAPTEDVTGVISAVSDSSVTVSTDGGPVTVGVDPSSGLTDGYQVGDLVDVSYTQNPDGSLTATDICFVEEDATGVVTSVSSSSLTITDDSTGQPDVFQANSDGVQINSYAFSGVSVGDHVDVSYHQSAGQLVADTVSEDSSSTSPN
ncbi:MAG TPA: DUF5666 domain-containing protein [Solirubrobacteraceae bacterium]|nr:DUF5666 domain-containing protein [Solirubrobacteraceae bacterium]